MDLIPLIKKVINDPSAQVRRECAIALHVVDSPEAAAVWAELAAQHTAGDRWELEALGIGARGKDEACFDAWKSKVGDKWDTPAGREIVWRLRTEKTAPLLAKIILDKQTPPEQLWSFFRAFDFLPNAAAKNEALLATLNGAGENKTIAVESLARLKNLDPAQAAQVKATVSKVLDAAKGTAEFVQLVEQFDLKDRGPDLLAFATEHPTDVAAGTAIRLVARDNPRVIEQALAGKESAKVAAALGASTDRGIVRLLAEIVADPKRDLAVRQAAVGALTKSKPGSFVLIDLAKKNRLGQDVTPLAASLLHNTSHRDVRDEAAKLFPAPVGKGAEKLPPMSKLLAMKGDAAHGKDVFVSATCVTCHMINGQGTSYGPELSEIGAKLPKEAIYTSILYPSAGISMGYEGWIVSTKDGDDLDGIIASQTADKIVLRRAGGINTEISKSDIKDKRQMKISIMPENLQQQMTTQDLVDLVEYLSGLKKATATK
jgi:putative heme-binding domain-containing protein